MLATTIGIMVALPSCEDRSTSYREFTDDLFGTKNTPLYVKTQAG